MALHGGMRKRLREEGVRQGGENRRDNVAGGFAETIQQWESELRKREKGKRKKGMGEGREIGLRHEKQTASEESAPATSSTGLREIITVHHTLIKKVISSNSGHVEGFYGHHEVLG
ncbi:hypothetical protein NQZ68_001697 [Dissostichus eleginoides]|nr:hypothetical protein NQZ68_001697 [Dissostichus eleginoides]